MGGNNGEALNLQELALEFLQGTGPENNSTDTSSGEGEPEGSTYTEHPAWKSILDAIPAEYHEAVKPTLQEWDTGVSKRFQKIHEEYEPYKQFEDFDPKTISEAVDVYQQLLNDPAATWETIGRAFGLSPQSSQPDSSDDEDFDGLDLPEPIRARLAKLDDHDRVLELVTSEIMGRKEAEEAAQEDAEFEQYLEGLQEEYGEFDADYVVGLIATGIDGEEAIQRYRQIEQRLGGGRTTPTTNAQPTPSSLPKVMSSSGGVPASTGRENLSKLSDQDTKSFVAEALRLAAQE